MREMRALVGMLPWVIVLAIAGAAVWLLLDRQVVLGTWVLAGLIVAHGLVHALYLVPPPDAPAGQPSGRAAPRWPFDLERSWLVALAGARRGRRLALILLGAIVGFSALAALATIGVLPVAWWPALVVLAAGASLVLLVLAFDIQLILGVGIDLVLLVVALTGAWTPAAA
jgi:hypothetical protein